MADWSKITSQGNVEDRRSNAPLMAGGIGGLGLVGTLIALAFTYFSSGGNISAVLQQLQGAQSVSQNYQSSDFRVTDQYPKFAATVLGSDNDLWSQTFSKSGKTYTPPKLVLFRSATQSGCGVVTSDVGPNYCPVDATIYLDETFFDELQTKFKAKGGDVAEAYVISHEVGHHVQNQLGIMDAVSHGAIGGKLNDSQRSIDLELQADCFAGIWANSVSKLGVIQPGEINEAIDAAAAVGDDRIQKETTGRVNPETWTHGSAAQRVDWFNRGYNSGEPNQCNTFGS
jgi:predicted metalloprotease